jgi:hypothetical protein
VRVVVLVGLVLVQHLPPRRFALPRVLVFFPL